MDRSARPALQETVRTITVEATIAFSDLLHTTRSHTFDIVEKYCPDPAFTHAWVVFIKDAETTPRTFSDLYDLDPLCFGITE